MPWFGCIKVSIGYNAYQHMLLKQLFAKWNAMLKAGQSVADAYQAIADDLGAVTTSLGYAGGLRSLMSLKKSLMMKNLGNRYSLAGEVVGVFNAIQKEQIETFQQFIKKVGVVKGLSQYSNYRAQQRSSSLQVDAAKTRDWSTKFLDNVFYNALNFFEDLLRVGASAVRRSDLATKQAAVMASAEGDYANGCRTYGGTHDVCF